MPWLELLLCVDQGDVAAVEQALELLGATAITLSKGEGNQQAILEPAPDEQPLWHEIEIKALFEQQEPQALMHALRQQLGATPWSNLSYQALADREWARAWMDHFRPISFGRRLWICPREQQPPETDAAVVYLDPGLAFGTGTHPTTALCLEYLDSQDLTGLDILDYGCGSGVLAIAALALGATRAVAVDHDPQALSATQENARHNDCEKRLSTFFPPQCPPLSVDICLANILAKPLVELAPRLAAATRDGGTLVLSGLMETQAEMVAAAFRPLTDRCELRVKHEWALLILRRHQDDPGQPI